MTDNKKIIWLASYPKSGNTWFRAFLANLLAGKTVEINDLNSVPIASSRQLFDEVAGISSSDLTFEETENLRPFVYEHFARDLETVLYMKIHDAFIYTSEKKIIVSEKASKKAIYLIRNPLDVAVSFAYHAGVDFARIVDIMNDPDYAFCNSYGKLNNQIQQKLLTWSNHVMSWTEQRLFPVEVIKYEDLHLNTFATFSKALKFLDLNYSDDEIERAIENTTFDKLQQQEREKGFKEKAPASDMFFRKGKIGSWHEELPSGLAEKIILQHGDVMKRFGYLDEIGKPLY